VGCGDLRANGPPPDDGCSVVPGPLFRLIVRHAVERRLASIVDTEIDRHAADLLDSDTLARLAVDAAEQQLAVLTSPSPGLYYTTLQEWVQEWLFPVYRRSVLESDSVWCPQWWRHPEAVARLESLWRAWEHLRQDAATGLSVWFRDHADHHMTVLLKANGPFMGCDGRHSDHPVGELPHDPPPEGMFERDEGSVARVPGSRLHSPMASPTAGWPREERTPTHR
jgi:Domain of unknown function (DUF4913)